MRYITDFLLIVIVLVLLSIFGFYGYGLYEYFTLTKDKSLEIQIADLKESEDYTPDEEMPKVFLNAIVQDIDPDYEKAPSINLVGFVKDLFHSVTQLEDVSEYETITQKTSNNVLYKNNRSLVAKMASAFGANTLQSKFDKVEILDICANTLYFGNDLYGIKNASNYYFEKEPSELSVDEATFLYIISKDPEKYNPKTAYKEAKYAQIELVEKLFYNNNISEVDYTYIKEDLNQTQIKDKQEVEF